MAEAEGPSTLLGAQVRGCARLVAGRHLLQHFASRTHADGLPCLRVTALSLAVAGADASFHSAELSEADLRAAAAGAQGLSASNRHPPTFLALLLEGLARADASALRRGGEGGSEDEDRGGGGGGGGGGVGGGGGARGGGAHGIIAHALLLEPVIVASGDFVVRHTLRLEPVPAPHRDAVEAAFACARECEALRAEAAAPATVMRPQLAAASAAVAAAAHADEDDDDDDGDKDRRGGDPFSRAYDAAAAGPHGAHEGKRARR